MAALVCPVRGCGRVLAPAGRGLACAAGHGFDRAKSGYVNLLGPQDKKAGDPGDRKESVEARRRTADRGLSQSLLETLTVALENSLPREREGEARNVGENSLPREREGEARNVGENSLPRLRGRVGEGASRPALLDVGCGDGFILANLAVRFACEAWGADISRAAAELAARRHPALSWIVANADRRLPFADGAFRAILSITGPKNPAEFRRLLEPGGLLVVAVSGPDDQAELREAVLGAAHAADREARMLAIFGAEFELVASADARQRALLDKAALGDLLAGSYRGARHAAQKRFAELAELEVTLSHRVLSFRPRARAAPGCGGATEGR